MGAFGVLRSSFGSAGVAFGRFWRAPVFIWLGGCSVWGPPRDPRNAQTLYNTTKNDIRNQNIL